MVSPWLVCCGCACVVPHQPNNKSVSSQQLVFPSNQKSASHSQATVGWSAEYFWSQSFFLRQFYFRYKSEEIPKDNCLKEVVIYIRTLSAPVAPYLTCDWWLWNITWKEHAEIVNWYMETQQPTCSVLGSICTTARLVERVVLLLVFFYEAYYVSLVHNDWWDQATKITGKCLFLVLFLWKYGFGCFGCFFFFVWLLVWICLFWGKVSSSPLLQ